MHVERPSQSDPALAPCSCSRILRVVPEPAYYVAAGAPVGQAIPSLQAEGGSLGVSTDHQTRTQVILP